MNVRILKVSSGELADAVIDGRNFKLPGIHEGWNFAFDKHIKMANATGFVLVTEETPDVLEGCLIFQIKEKIIPYMAYVEVAPHNRVDPKRYDYVAGCLIAFAFKQSLIKGKGDYKGWLSFDAMEKHEKDQIKLMAMYSQKYNARRVDDTQMVIADADGEALIAKYLERKSKD